jgi:hypothetical protein
MKKFFPKNAKAGLPRVNRSRSIRPRYQDPGATSGVDLRKEFNILMEEKYTDLPQNDRNILWTKIGSILIMQSGSQPIKNRLMNALQQAHKSLLE